MSFSRWYKTKLGEICDINKKSYSSKENWEYINYLDTGNITENEIECVQLLNTKTDNIPSRAKRKVVANDIVYSTVRPNQKHYGIIKKPLYNMLVSTGFAVITGKADKADNRYLYYYLAQQHIVDMLHTIGEHSTSAYPAIKPSDIEGLDVLIPLVDEQKNIADTLICLDEKIELNNRINKNLEKIAQSIFKSWFVDFEPFRDREFDDSELGKIPKGWRVGTLEDVLFEIEAGNRPKGGVGNLYAGIPSIGAENIIGLGRYDFSKEKYVSEEYFKSMNKGIVKNWDVLLYKDGAQLGRKTMFAQDYPHKKCCINSHVFILRCNDLISQPYLYFWLDQGNMTQNIINLNTNSAQPGINQPAVKQLKILIPDKQTVEKFQELIENPMCMLFENCKENQRLTSVREILLPKLMSGEIRVPIEGVQ